MKRLKKIICCLLLISINKMHCYNLPSLNLGATNILDGGPLRPRPGYYYTQYATFAHVEQWMGPDGKELFCTQTPKFNGIALNYSFIYQFAARNVLNGHLGFSFDFSTWCYSKVDRNNIGIKNGDIGFGDSGIGIYVQWDPIMIGDRPIFVHRLLFGVGMPTGVYDPCPGIINPGKNIFFFDPYWAATLYFTPKFTASWRLFYLYCFTNHKKHLHAGHAVHLNYSLAYEILSTVVIGINGYFLRQLKNDTLCGEEVPDSKEQTFAIGPGAVYLFEQRDLFILGHLYYENAVKNRTKGMSINFSLIKNF